MVRFARWYIIKRDRGSRKKARNGQRTDGDVLLLELGGRHVRLVRKHDHAVRLTHRAEALVLDTSDLGSECDGEGGVHPVGLGKLLGTAVGAGRCGRSAGEYVCLHFAVQSDVYSQV